MTIKKTAVRKKKSTKGTAMLSMAEYEKQMAAIASDQSARVKPDTSQAISIKGGEFAYQGTELGETLEVALVDFVYLNTYYVNDYDPDNTSTPACYSIDTEAGDMVPAENSPNVQSDNCNDCPHFEWGTGARGKGKACGEHRLIAVVAADDLNADPKDIEIATLRTPITSNKNFDKYASGVSKTLNRPLLGVISKLGFDDDFDWPVLTFEVEEVINKPGHIQKLINTQESARELLEVGFDPSGYTEDEAPKPKPRRGRASTKKATAKKAPAKKKAARRSKFSK